MNHPPPPPLPESRPTRGGHRLIVIGLAMLSLVFAWGWMALISSSDPWYRNTDMNMHNLVDALSINSDVRPNPFDQPALPLKYLLALDYRIRHALGVLPVSTLPQLDASRDPLREIPPLIHVGRVHHRILVILFILAAAALTFAVTGKVETACLTVILLCGSSGLLFHGLLVRPELMCVGFGLVLALLCTWRALAARSWWGNQTWLFLAGILVGFSMLEKLPGICYLALCYGWCWLSALTAAPTEAQPDRSPPAFAWGLLPASGGLAVLWLLDRFGPYHDALGPVVIVRLRLAAVLIAVLPLLSLWAGRNRVTSFLLDRARELSLLGGGALAALFLGHLLLRGLMSEANAADYFAGVLHFVIDPAPYMRDLLAAKPETGRVFMLFVKQTPFLFVTATMAVIGVGLLRPIPLRLRAFIALLWGGAVAMTWVMSKRHFLAQYIIFLQVPLLLVWSLGLSALGDWWQKRHRVEGHHWVAPLVITASFVLMLTVYFRLQPLYTFYQNDADLPVNSLTLTFIFDHDAHSAAYLQIMKSHYGTREQFATILERYLADPANRH